MSNYHPTEREVKRAEAILATYKTLGSVGNPDFDWSLYEGGYNGGTKLVINHKVASKRKEKIYSHEMYAQELYEKFENAMHTTRISPKDSYVGNLYSIVNMAPVSDHEIVIDSNNGMSAIVDLNKEPEFLESIGAPNVGSVIHTMKVNPDWTRELLSQNLVAKALENNRVSLWEGRVAKIENEFRNELRSKNGPNFAYPAKIISVNNGGYTVDVLGVKCFLPGSLAAAGPITDFEALVGKTINVCVVNFAKNTKNFVVSFKKYLEKTLPGRVRREIIPGKPVDVKVTGKSKNGVFCAIKDDMSGDYIFPSLMHRSTMSPDAEADFENDMYQLGDMFHAFVHRVTWDGDKFRIVIGDKMPVLKDDKSEEKDENKEK